MREVGQNLGEEAFGKQQVRFANFQTQSVFPTLDFLTCLVRQHINQMDAKVLWEREKKN